MGGMLWWYMKEFLTTVITTEEGYFLLATRINGQWVENWFKWPNDVDNIIEYAAKVRGDVYFSSHLFASKDSHKANVLPTYTIQADLDAAKVTNLPFEPIALVRTSEGRHHAYWKCNSLVTEEISRSVTYTIPDCDPSGWTLGHRMRVPNTYNFKYDPPYKIKVVNYGTNLVSLESIKLLPSAEYKATDEDIEWIENPDTDLGTDGPYELLELLKPKYQKVVNQYDTRASDRSVFLWSLYGAAFRSKCTRNDVFTMAYRGINNKFKDLTYGGVRELKKDILRSEKLHKLSADNLVEQVVALRKVAGFTFEKKSSLSKLCIESLNLHGTFFHSTDDNIWYVPNQSGRPIQVGSRSSAIETLLESLYGINASEIEFRYVTKSLETYCRNLPNDTLTSSISYYDEPNNIVYLHSGKRDVFKITADSVTTQINGHGKILFPWNPQNEPFYPDDVAMDWSSVLLQRVTDNVLNMSKEEAEALIKVWFMFLLLRSSCISRPILSLFGQPGAGKSTLFKRLYTLLYGRSRELGSVTNPEDFDHAVSADPLVVLDNVDTWERWLPDRLALSAASSDIVKRKLYTDNDSVLVRRQAVIGLTAHNPKFGREDVADRLLIIMFERLKHFIPEKYLLDDIANKRSMLWSSIIQDLQKVLRTPQPEEQEIPQFRIEDFAAIGYRISSALDIKDAFNSSLRKVYKEQRLFSMEEESILVSAIQSYAETCQRKGTSPWLTPSDMWSELGNASTDQMAFNRTYRNAVAMSRKVWSLQESLKTVFDVQYKIDEARGTRVWKFEIKKDNNG